MPQHRLALLVLPQRLAICRLEPTAAIPDWALGAGFFAITRTGEELSIVCPDEAVPEDMRAERGWRCLRVAGVIEFSAVGVLASLFAPLAAEGISVFAFSTFDTDYLLVREADFEAATAALRHSGHAIA